MSAQRLTRLSGGSVERFLARNYICATCRRSTTSSATDGARQYSRSRQWSQITANTTCRSKNWQRHRAVPTAQWVGPRFLSRTAQRTRTTNTSSTTPTPHPVTSVNASSRVSPDVASLYNALRELEHFAANYVNLGRLKLAIRSLEDDGVMRIGVLALKRGQGRQAVPQAAARDLVSAILGDVLSDKQEWEKLLEQEDSRAILIRPGSTLEARDSNSIFRTIYADTPLLRKHNMEILISTLDIDVARTAEGGDDAAGSEGLLDAILVPRLEASASSAGGYSSVGYPIHKALLIGQSTDDVLALGLFARTLGISSVPPELLKVSIDDARRTPTQTQSSWTEASSIVGGEQSLTSFVDIGAARKAVAAFRSSISNATAYQHGWESSGVGPISDWLLSVPQTDSKLSGTLQTYIKELLSATSAQTRLAETDLRNQGKSDSVSDATRSSIGKAVDVWAEAAHRELRDSLEAAFTSRQWHKLAWWKLSWRVDEVGMILDDLLQRAWLPQAEKGIVFLAGRVQESGLSRRKTWETIVETTPVFSTPSSSVTKATQDAQAFHTPDTAPVTLNATFPDELRDTSFTTLDIPYPQHIPSARRALIQTTVPDMHALAQRLVLTNLSTTALSSALSALYYVSFPLTTLYEAGAIAALGLVIGLKRMQNQWHRARQDWQAAARDEGRRALIATEGSMRSLIGTDNGSVVDEVLLREIENAKLLVATAQSALESIGSKTQ